MYGMIHRGLRQMVIEQSGESVWSRIEDKLGIGPEHLISVQTYDDSLTLAIIGSVAEELRLSLSQCLVAYGRYWIRFAAQGAYGGLMNFTGTDFCTFIENLDRMHQTVHAAMSEAIVPSFKITGRGEDYIKVEYRSEREGLEPFVAGLLEGLLDHFAITGNVEPVSKCDNAPEFIIRFAPA